MYYKCKKHAWYDLYFLILALSAKATLTDISKFTVLVMWHIQLSLCQWCQQHILVMGPVLVAPLPIQILPNTSGKATEYSPYVWASATMWTTQIKILAMGFNLAQNWPLYCHLERESVDLRISPSNYIVVHLKNDKLIHIYVTYSALIITWEKRLGNSFYFYLSNKHLNVIWQTACILNESLLQAWIFTPKFWPWLRLPVPE